jgi:hypothetical protein
MRERRLYPRFAWECEVQLCGGAGDGFAARSLDLSVAGIGLALSREAVVGLAQRGSILCPGDHLVVVLPPTVATAMAELALDCRVKEVRRVALHSYVVGTWFEQLDENARAVLEALVDAARRRRWN